MAAHVAKAVTEAIIIAPKRSQNSTERGTTYCAKTWLYASNQALQIRAKTRSTVYR